MNLFGYELTLKRKAAVTPMTPADWGYGQTWTPIIREPFTGAWQRNMEVARTDALAYSIVWACITLIASDIGKLWLNLVKVDRNGIRTPADNPAYSGVLRKPNHYSTRVKFFEHWMLSKLTWGNTYVLKARNNRGGPDNGNVTDLYVLDPSRVKTLVTPDGAVYYSLSRDDLAGIEDQDVVVPASEIIHDICVPLYHPLCGVSPIYASGLAATQGLKIQGQSVKLFANGSTPSGVLTAPHQISNDVAERLKLHWEQNYAGESNVGKVAVLGDGLTYQPMTMNAVDAQLIDQLKWANEQICATFHVPGYMVGIGPAPPYTDIQSINLQYYTQALQNPIENIEILLREGLELSPEWDVEFDLDALARMDAKTNADIATKLVAGGIESPNEGRARFDRRPKPGGDSVYMQQQMYSLEALAKRDAAPPTPTITPEPETPEPDTPPEPEEKGMTPHEAGAYMERLLRAA